MEDDYGMIDGIINNGERSKDKEPGMDKPLCPGGSSLRPKKGKCAERKAPREARQSPGKRDEPEL